MSISERLRSERHRLGLTQTEAATAGGVGFSTYQGYERGTRAPDAECLEKLYVAGFDVLYIVAGARNDATLSNDETALLTGLNSLDERTRKVLLSGVLAAVQTYKSRSE